MSSSGPTMKEMFAQILERFDKQDAKIEQLAKDHQDVSKELVALKAEVLTRIDVLSDDVKELRNEDSALDTRIRELENKENTSENRLTALETWKDSSKWYLTIAGGVITTVAVIIATLIDKFWK